MRPVKTGRFLLQRKGEMMVACKHEKIMCRNCVKICLICGAELPADFGTEIEAVIQDGVATIAPE